ncbi:flagellar basal-body MS-ring/collar protein FliF [Clostridium tetani]|uniref:Flagellar M-ring protein n=1 Tax=Clostridium tetani TaxID=1513 RepID=A0ABY0ENR7_CLOTA|nr:flagellar basal-body MS-ring/collar protein FliF [Clostridium tetani]KHO38904.1 flagellar M-ring protein FliF [Clostridium tetani]RXI52070.1 flagellar basal body M-ring protein FliF [Clostridium tetani]RXI67956.1 flagellar basal body M-ring protein FliF [Clostridium tetani]CDI49807.1 flagellar MS-ring protein [Clostridium tetani 12124569]
MNKLSQWFNTFKDKIKDLSKKKKIAYGAIAVGIIGALISGIVYISKPKYAILFSNMEQEDMGTVYNKLKDSKENFKVDGNTILVPKEKVDSLRMEVMSQVPIKNGSNGFELLDKNKFGATEEEMKINYQRALQGEIERTIKGFPEIENARVHLVMPEDSVFIKDDTPAKASITLKIKPYKKITDNQVKAIVALASGSVKNLPKENVEINDTNQILTKDLFKEDEFDSSESVQKQQALKKEYEKTLEDKVTSMLEAVYGKERAKIKINADLNFDEIQDESTVYDPKNVVVSEKNIKETTPGGNDLATGGSPVDDNMRNRTGNNEKDALVTHEENVKNYEVSERKNKTLRAPGSVRRLTVSVVLDGNLDNATRNAVQNTVKSAVGYNEQRGDTISVEGLPFDTAYKERIEKDKEAMEEEFARDKKMNLYKILAVLGVLALGIIIGILVKKRRNKEDNELDLINEGLDVVIDDEITEEKPKFKPIQLEEESESAYIEREIRKYATEKPDQVIEIVKAWLAEDER